MINGDVIVTKQFGGPCLAASSGLRTGQDSSSNQGGSVRVSPQTSSGEAGFQAGAALVSSLAALDTCGPGQRNDFEPPPVQLPEEDEVLEDDELEPAVR